MGLLTSAPPYFAFLSGRNVGQELSEAERLLRTVWRHLQEGAAGVSKLLGMWRELLPCVTQACTSAHGADGKMKHSNFENVETELS